MTQDEATNFAEGNVVRLQTQVVLTLRIALFAVLSALCFGLWFAAAVLVRWTFNL